MAPTLTDLLRQRSDLVLASSQRSSIGLLDPATAVAGPVGPKTPQLVALAALAALILALGLVAILEGVRPRVRGRRWVAAELDAPLLGHLPTTDLAGRRGVRSLRDFGSAAAVIRARFAGRPVLMLPVEKKYEKWAARICSEVETLTGVRIQRASDVAVDQAADSSVSGSPQDSVLIALSPSVESQRNLEELLRNAEVLGWPFVGVLTFRRRHLIDRWVLAAGGRQVRPVVTPTPSATATATSDEPTVATTNAPTTETSKAAPTATTSAPEPAAGGVLSGQKMRRMP